MLTKKTNEGRNQIEFNSLEDLVPKDHLLRKVGNVSESCLLGSSFKKLIFIIQHYLVLALFKISPISS
ncbi:hypothetical protein ACQPUZ_09965 [Clostridium tertium]